MKIKAFGIIRGRSKYLTDDKLHEYEYQKRKKIPQEKVIMVFKSERTAKKWKNKWMNKDRFSVIPLEIIY